MVAIWGGGAVLLIGGVWPTLLSVMIGAGLGRPKSEKKDDYDLDRFSRSAPEEAAKPSARTVSADDQEKLRKLRETLERNLAAAGRSCLAEAARVTCRDLGRRPKCGRVPA